MSPRSVFGTPGPEPEDSAAAVMPPATPAPMIVQNHQRCQGRGGCRGLLGGGSTIISGWRRRAALARGAGEPPRLLSSSATFSSTSVAIECVGPAGEVAIVIEERLIDGADLAVALGDVVEQPCVGLHLVGAPERRRPPPRSDRADTGGGRARGASASPLPGGSRAAGQGGSGGGGRGGWNSRRGRCDRGAGATGRALRGGRPPRGTRATVAAASTASAEARIHVSGA